MVRMLRLRRSGSLMTRSPGSRPVRPPRVQAPRRCRRARGPLAQELSAAAQPAPQLRGQHAARLVRQRPRRASPAAAADDPHGARHAGQHLLLPHGRAGPARARGQTTGTRPWKGLPMSSLAPTLEAYFTDRLIRQRRVSPHTIASYRDTFRLLLGYINRTTGTPPSRLEITDLDAARIGAFLQHLEHERGNTARTRNIRLAAIHSFFHYCALRHPEHAALTQCVLAIPAKRATKRTVTFLTPKEVQTLLDAPNRSTWAGRRDHALLLTAVQTGLRISELLGLTRADTQLGTGAHVRTVGKGRKERVAPLTKQTVAVLRAWLRETTDQPGSPLFPSRDGGTLTRDAIERRLAQHVKTAQQACPALRSKRA